MSEEDFLWKVGRVCLWPNALFTGDHFEWRVPVDDENTLSVTWAFSRVPREQEPYVQEKILAWHGPVRDAVTGRWGSSHVMNHDFIAWIGQGTDSTEEHLGTSDRGILMLRTGSSRTSNRWRWRFAEFRWSRSTALCASRS